jgi:hypothetical protein
MIPLDQIISNFRVEGRYISSERIGSGHINDSYQITTTDEIHSGYVLQRINHTVFRNIPGLMNNIRLVTDHINSKINSGDPVAGNLSCLRIIQSAQDQDFYTDEEGNFWRMYNFIAGTKSYDIVNDPDLAAEGGTAFATFQYLTSDLPIDNLVDTIPGFHNADFRLKNFRDVVQKDPVDRVKDVLPEISFVEERSEEMRSILKLGQRGKIPLRVTHNDTKFNNILFDLNNKARCIVDLDTVMPGYILYDFGDAIRTGANTTAEDETDLSKVGINLEMFENYSRGYLSIAKVFLNETEKTYLAFSAKFMTFIIGLRFLTDFLNGDKYFRIHYNTHNLSRARVQFRLLESMEENFGKMKELVRSCS